MATATVVIPSGSSQTRCPVGSQLVSQVARIVGGEGENKVRSAALDTINRVRVRMNRRDWRFTKTTHTAITLVDGTATYSLPAAFKRPVFAQLLDSNSKVFSKLEYKDDAWFAAWWEQQDGTGPPTVYELRNDQADGLVTVYPTPDAGAAADHTLRVEYFSRITVISDSTVAVDFPEEMCDVLIYGGQYLLLKEREKDNRELLAIARADYDRAFSDLIRYDRQFDDNRTRFRISPGVKAFGTLFIKV